MNKKSVAVQIAGKEYKIRSDSDQEELRKIAAYVDRAMQRVREGTRTIDSLDVAVLTCLNLTREILTLRDQNARVASGDSIRALIERVEAVLPRHQREEASSAEDREGEAETPVARESVKTIEWQSVELLRARDAADSSGVATASGELEEESQPETRMAAGGHDRVS